MPRPRRPVIDLFFARIKIAENGCWECVNKPLPSGYCRILGHYFHRLAWTLLKGVIPDGLCVCHKCDNRKCGNPEHLFLGTYEDNQIDAAAKGRLARGERHGVARLTDAKVRDIRGRFNDGQSKNSLSKQFGVSRTAIQQVVERFTWTHV